MKLTLKIFYSDFKSYYYYCLHNISYNKIFIAFILLFFSGKICSQEKTLTRKEIDSIYKVISTDELFNKEGIARATELYYIAKEVGYKEGQIKALYRLAEVESGMLNSSRATDHIITLKSLTLALGDYENYIKALCLESKNFYTEKNYTQSLKTLNQAKKYLPEIENVEVRRKAKIDIDIYKWFTIESLKFPKESYKDSLIATSEKICKEAFLLKDENLRAKRLLFSSTMAATTLIEMGRQSEAQKYLKIGEKQLKITGINKYPVADYYKVKGDYEYRNKEKNKNYLDSALSNYNKSLKICNLLEYGGLLKTLYPKIAKVYADKNDLEKQLLFQKKEIALKDSLDYQSAIEQNEFKKKAYSIKSQSEERVNPVNKILFYVIVILLALVGISAFIFKKYLSTKKHNNQQAIEEKPFENDTMSKDKIDISSVKELTSLLYEDVNAFHLAFNEAYPNFKKNLLKINPAIKPSDVEFCTLIKLNLETKEIAVLKKMTVGAVEAKKYRIRQKLNISREQNMYIFISNI